MAAHAKRVIGSDINRRALNFAAFNAVLNNKPNFEVRQGDRFEPVKKRPARPHRFQPAFLFDPQLQDSFHR
jgi:methylase of polypeptide subunit release factors